MKMIPIRGRPRTLSVEQIAAGLEKVRQTGPDQWTACCPAHPDENPSLALTQKGDHVLVYCRSGCGQDAVLDALRARGLWPESRAPRADKPTTLYSATEMRAFVAAHERNLKRGIPTATRDQRRYRQYVRALCRPFTPEEIVEAHLYCLVYQGAVRRGETPTADEDDRFLLCNRVHDVMQGWVPYAW